MDKLSIQKKRLRRIINTVKWMLKKRNESNTKLGEEVEYRITFYNTVENGKLEKVLVEDTT